MFIYLLKELRQLRRDTGFYGTLILQLGLYALVMKLYNGNSETAKAELCNMIWLPAAVIIAITMASRWREELNDDALNPMVTTPLSPVSVVGGKFLATFIAVAIPAAVAQIFNLFTLPRESFGFFFGLVLPMDMALVLSGSTLLLAFVSVFRKRVPAALPGIFLLLALLIMRGKNLAELSNEDDLLEAVKLLLPVPPLFALSVAAVSPAGSDRVVPVRIAMLFTLAAGALIGVLNSRQDFDTALAVNVGDALLFGAFLSVVAAAMERRAQSNRVAAAIRRIGRALRPLRILCSSGAVTELVLSLILLTAALATRFRGSWKNHTELYSYTVLLFYTALTLFVSGMMKRATNKEPSRGGIYVVVMGVGTLAGLIFNLPSTPRALMEDMGNAWNILFIVLNALSILLLIPTVVEFVKSLERP